jgi:hypothetical protein
MREKAGIIGLKGALLHRNAFGYIDEQAKKHPIPAGKGKKDLLQYAGFLWILLMLAALLTLLASLSRLRR